jgi:hypothetical protein
MLDVQAMAMIHIVILLTVICDEYRNYINYAEWHYAECRSAECRVTHGSVISVKLVITNKRNAREPLQTNIYNQAC